MLTLCCRHYIKLATYSVKKGKGYPYSIPSDWSRADPGVQEVSMQVTFEVNHPAITFHQTSSYLPGHRASPSCGRYQVILFGNRGT